MTHASMPQRQPPVLVGRDRELELVRHRLTETLAGHGGTVLVGGEAGIGKTTLVESIARSGNILVLTGQCYDLATTPPFGPWFELIGDYPSGDGLPDLPREVIVDREQARISSQAAFFQFLLTFLINVSVARPLMLVLEDLHWADDASLDLLRYVARGITDRRIILVATYRDDEITRQHPLFQLLPLLVREADAERLRLTRLDRHDLEQLTTGRYQLDSADLARLITFLARMSDGNPLYATELLRSLEEEGRLLRDGDGWRLTDLERAQIPSLVQQVIETRLGRLDEATQHLLEVAAVIGQDVPLDLWSSVSEADDAELADTIEDAVAAGLLGHTEGGRSVRFTHAIIREAIYQRQLLLRRRPWHQRVASALIVSPQPDPDVIVHHLEQTNDPRLVDWLIRSGERAQHRFVWPVAGKQFDRAQEILASDPGRIGERGWLLFRIALLVRNVDPATSIARLAEAEQIATDLDDQLLAQLARAHKGLVLCYGRDVRQGLIDLEAGTLALERLGEADANRLQDVTARWELILGVQGRATLAQWLTIVGRLEQARSLLVDWSDAERDASADAYRTRGLIAANLGDPEMARRWIRRSRAVYEARSDRLQAGDDANEDLMEVQLPYAADHVEERRSLARTAQELWADTVDDVQSASGSRLFDVDDPSASFQEPIVRGSQWARQSIDAVECFISGEWSRAVELFNSSRTYARFLVSPYLGWWLMLARHRGEYASAWLAIDEIAPDGPATEPGAIRYANLSIAQLTAAELALDASDVTQSRAWLEAHDRLLDWSGAVRSRAENQLVWARYHQLTGDAITARECAEQGLADATVPRQPLLLIVAQRVCGTLAVADRRYSDAERHLTEALRLADACAAPFERALALLALAELRVVTREVTQARQLVEEARSICEPLQAMPTLARLDQLEAQLGQRPQTDVLPAGLSQREAEVLRLVAQGLTDAEVAERLFIARRTVNTHLTAIYTKLGVNSRVAATRFAVEHGLT